MCCMLFHIYACSNFAYSLEVALTKDQSDRLHIGTKRGQVAEDH